jgi:hypothetical protein
MRLLHYTLSLKICGSIQIVRFDPPETRTTFMSYLHSYRTHWTLIGHCLHCRHFPIPTLSLACCM